MKICFNGQIGKMWQIQTKDYMTQHFKEMTHIAIKLHLRNAY